MAAVKLVSQAPPGRDVKESRRESTAPLAMLAQTEELESLLGVVGRAASADVPDACSGGGSSEAMSTFHSESSMMGPVPALSRGAWPERWWCERWHGWGGPAPLWDMGWGVPEQGLASHDEGARCVLPRRGRTCAGGACAGGAGDDVSTAEELLRPAAASWRSGEPPEPQLCSRSPRSAAAACDGRRCQGVREEAVPLAVVAVVAAVTSVASVA